MNELHDHLTTVLSQLPIHSELPFFLSAFGDMHGRFSIHLPSSHSSFSFKHRCGPREVVPAWCSSEFHLLADWFKGRHVIEVGPMQANWRLQLGIISLRCALFPIDLNEASAPAQNSSHLKTKKSASLRMELTCEEESSGRELDSWRRP